MVCSNSNYGNKTICISQMIHKVSFPLPLWLVSAAASWGLHNHSKTRKQQTFFHGVYIKNVLGRSLSHGGLWVCFFAPTNSQIGMSYQNKWQWMDRMERAYCRIPFLVFQKHLFFLLSNQHFMIKQQKDIIFLSLLPTLLIDQIFREWKLNVCKIVITIAWFQS